MSAKLAEALAAFQAEMPTVAKAHTADVQTQKGKNYTYTYAGLADVTEAAMPILTKHGLAFSALPRLTDRGYELAGQLLHSSGESLEGALPITGNTPQEMGSSITYMRRYLFGCMTGLVTDDDDDGAMAQRSRQKPRPKRTHDEGSFEPLPEPAADWPPAAEPGSRTGQITDKQRGLIGRLMREVEITEKQDALDYVAGVIDRTVESRNDLTKQEASKVIDALAALKDLERQGA